MASFQDPSIISMVSAPSQGNSDTSSIVTENRNDINSFLREAESKRAEEEDSKKGSIGGGSSVLENNEVAIEGDKELELEEDEETKELRKQQELENWKLDLGPYNDETRLRYSADFLYNLKDSEDNFVPPGLPPKSYYRLKNKQPIRTNWIGNNQNNNNQNNGRNNYNEGGSSTGSMGNFNLNRRTHDRGFNRHGNNNSHNNHRRNNNNRENRHNKKFSGEDEDSWLADLDKDAPLSADGFEAYRAKVKLEERKRNGELVEEDTNQFQQTSESKNTIDSHFRAVKPSLTSNPSGGATVGSSSDSGRKSKFLGIFSQGSNQQPSDSNIPSSKPSNDGVSKILSLLDSGEKNAQVGSNNTTPQISQASISTPKEQHSGFNSQRSQFFGQDNKTNTSTGSTPILPPGLTPPSGSQVPPNLPTGGSKDSFFMSLMNKGPEAGKPDSNQTQSPIASTQSPALSKVEGSRILPPGLQGPPGLTQQTPPPSQAQQAQSQQQQQQQQSQQQQQQQQPNQKQQPQPPHPQQSSQQPQNPGFPPGFPPQFQNPQNRPPQGPIPQGQFVNPPPGFNPQHPPPWISQQFPPNLPQGRFIPPPLPNGVGFPPQFRPQGGPPGPQGEPRFILPQEFQGNPNGPPVFLPPFGGPGGPGGPGSNPDGSQRERFPPGFFNGPPPGFPNGNPPPNQ
ncbi:hypothetical protein BN7_529 [Wickerhamomyces ciferrii]|uniref:Uncharacterized protein n=1 Tax=Wickerhamomyces ciferrii (strain ATCC 14091 / BCRC 22168 / CBS 111 / JCM 3599 / NBRC 0793 / NRRL Y-1031 F-60-10) TaxID=1206466 RepID=K0KFI4_WICCF|nr:uncharacterized protein BN7_529 [Wickerhamomyces ciferrii]CCH40992.1 hypothetical protein BN7_529 [Wickerhamomyces ciferrii]